MAALCAGLIAFLFVRPSSASFSNPFVWQEDPDAGDLPATAQTVVGAGPLYVISGRLGSSAQVDMYRICLAGGRTFSATTLGTNTRFDSQLFLFDSQGQGVYANDDNGRPNAAPPPDTVQSDLPPGSVQPPNTGQSPDAPGVYYLAISAYDRDPVSGPGGEAGTRVFQTNDAFRRVVGPRPGVGPVTGWRGEGDRSAGYQIVLTGAEFFTGQGVCRPGVSVPTATANPAGKSPGTGED